MESKDDDYWNDSTNKSFNFDEEDVAVLEIPSHSSTNKRSLFGEDTSSELAYGSAQTELPLHMIISDENLELVLQEQSRHMVTIPKGISLEDEVKLLRRKIQEFNYAPSTDSVLRKLILGQPCSLEMFRSMCEKEQLLDQAIASGSGNAILRVVLFLDRTLKKKLFYSLLQTRNEAVHHYMNYLALRLKVTECTDLLVFLGRHHEASLLQFSIFVCSTSNVEFKKQRLKKIYSDYFSQPGSNTFYAQLVVNYMNLLEYQTNELHATGASGRAVAIQDKSVLETLHYVCGKYKWGDTALQTNDNPFKLAENHQVSQAQFEWIALNERAKQQAWLDFDHIFERKAWLNLKQKSFKLNIPVDRTILRLHALHAPDPVLSTFLAKVEDPQRRLALARKVQCKHGIVDALASLKDRTELEEYRSTLESGTEERLYAENALKSLNNKWKSDAMKLIK
ncbi:vacuolar protein sorting-associated protein 16B [Anopheles bellator]|uniref:vacuolar protein sorting-associated protein 16B n=1 Tax=Anopheles bellator TaxID=139047 RepID=UPI002648D49B|nr:vacuolar protein sorting-associated protein 16B [Anopheles bellator]